MEMKEYQQCATELLEIKENPKEEVEDEAHNIYAVPEDTRDSYLLHSTDDEHNKWHLKFRRKYDSFTTTMQQMRERGYFLKAKVGVVAMVMIICVVVLFVNEENDHLNVYLNVSKHPTYISIDKTPMYVVRMKVSKAAIEGIVDAEDNNTRYYNVSVSLQGLHLVTHEWETVGATKYISIENEEGIAVIQDFDISKMEQKEYGYKFRLEIATVKSPSFVMQSEFINMPQAAKNEVFIAFLILIVVYISIVFEIFDRTICALIGSFISVATLSYLQLRPTFHDVVSWIDFDTLGVLFGMMAMVGLLSRTGVFEWSAIKAYKLSGGDIWKLSVILSLFTGVISAFLDNVTTILLIAPVTITLCELLQISPIPFVLLEVMFSNVGGTATPIGDPPNIIIVSEPSVRASGYANFLSFTVHVTPGIILASICCVLYVRYTFKPEPVHTTSRRAFQVHAEASVWKKAIAAVDGTTPEEVSVKTQLSTYLDRLEESESEEPSDEPPSQEQFIRELEQKHQIHNIKLFKISAWVIGLVMAMFFFHSITEIPMVWIAIIGFMMHVVLVEEHTMDEILEKVHVGTLLFFAGLFVMMHCMGELGLIEYIGNGTASIIQNVPAGNSRLCAAILLIMWVSAFVSVFIDNIPFTTTMIPVVVKLAREPLGLPLAPLLWALVYGVCLGGNGMLIGASANVVAAGICEQKGYHISFLAFSKIGFPFMMISCIVCTFYLLITHVWWGWYDASTIKY